MTEQSEEYVGYQYQPRHGRIKKGERRNPNGRPKGKMQKSPLDFLDELVTIHEDGEARQVTAAEAFLLRMLQLGLKGNEKIQKDLLEVIEHRKSLNPGDNRLTVFNVKFPKPGDPERIMTRVGMTTRLDRYGPAARVRVEPWLVQAALARLGDRQLSPDDQARIHKITRTPDKVKWPPGWNFKS